MTIFKYILIVFHLIAGAIFLMYGLSIDSAPGDSWGYFFIIVLFILAVNMLGVALCAVFREWYGMFFAGLSMLIAAPLFFLVGASAYYYPMSFALLLWGVAGFFYAMEISAIIFFNLNRKPKPEQKENP